MKKIIIGAVLGLCMALIILSEVANGRQATYSENVFSGGVEHQFVKSFDAVPGQTLIVKTDIGSICIEGTAESKVTIKAEMTGRENQMADFEITANAVGQGIEVIGTRKSQGLFSFWNNFDVAYTITVPREYQIKLETSGGVIKIQSLKGNVTSKTSGGNIILRDVNGSAQIKTSGGNIELNGLDGKVVARTSGGHIDVEKSSGWLDVETSGGHIRAESVRGGLRAETSGGNIKVNITDDFKGVDVETSGGDIEIGVPAGIKADLDAATSGGEVECRGLEVTMSGKIQSNRIKGKIAGGGEVIRARTSGGDVVIRALK